MGTGAPPLPPESMWPTGDMPPELRIAMAQESAAMGAAAGHEIVPSGIAVPPREFDAASLEAERPAIEEGDALIARLRSVAGNAHAPKPPALPTYGFGMPTAPADMHYAFPLSADGNRAEVNLYGKISAADVELLVDYLKLTAKKMNNGNVAGTERSVDSRPDSQGDRVDLARTRGRVRKRASDPPATEIERSGGPAQASAR